MCLVLDTNRFGDLFSPSPDPRYRPLIQWLHEAGIAVLGGTKYLAEIDRHNAARRYFAQLVRAGRAISADRERVDTEAAVLSRNGVCRSDDQHLLALARVTGARTLCSEDQDLIADFTDPALLRRPRGRVYRRAEHAHLLHHDLGCHQPPPRKGRRRKPRD